MKRYDIPVILENDVNATAIGFGRCYEQEFPSKDPDHTNMTYLHFEKGCMGAINDRLSSLLPGPMAAEILSFSCIKREDPTQKLR